MATVLIVDDEADIRYLLRRIFELGDPPVAVAGEATTADEAVELWRTLRPDVVVLDYRLSGETGVGAARRILAEDPGQVIVMFTAYRDARLESEMLSVGIRAVLPKVEIDRLRAVVAAQLPSMVREPARTVGRRIVVVGAAGFVGSFVAEHLLGRGDQVVAVDHPATAQWDNLATLAGRDGLTTVGHNPTHPLELSGPVDAVMYLADISSARDHLSAQIDTLRDGTLGTLHALALARGKGARYILSSSAEVYGDPLVHPQPETFWGHVNPVGPRAVYTEAKRLSEALTMAHGRTYDLSVGISRTFNTYGPRMRRADGRVLSKFIVQALTGRPLTVYGDGSQTRTFAYVDDQVAGLVALLDSDHTGPVNLGHPEEITITELARTVLAVTHSSSEIAFEPLPPDDPRHRAPDITRARNVIGWEPVTGLKDGLLLTVAWFAGEMAKDDLSPR